jgi:hypothetical protein
MRNGALTAAPSMGEQIGRHFNREVQPRALSPTNFARACVASFSSVGHLIHVRFILMNIRQTAAPALEDSSRVYFRESFLSVINLSREACGV